MRTTFAPALRSLPDKRLDAGDPDDIQKLDTADLSLDDARQAVGRAIARAIARSDSSLKDFGDESQVNRWKKGENPNFARLWRCRRMRRELLVALAEESGFAEVRLTVEVRP